MPGSLPYHRRHADHARRPERSRRRVHLEGGRCRGAPRARVRRRERVSRLARRTHGFGVDPGRGDDRRAVPVVPDGRDDPRSEPVADDRLGIDVARQRHDLHDPGPVHVEHGAAVPAGGGALLPRCGARSRGDDSAPPPLDRPEPRRAAVPRGDRVRRGAARDRWRLSGERMDLPGNGHRGGDQARGVPSLSDAERRSRSAACPAEGRARHRARAGARRRWLHPRLPAVGRARRRVARLGDRSDAAPCVDGSGVDRAALSRTEQARRRHERVRDLGPLRALHRRRGGGGRRHHRGPARPADDGGRLRCSGAGHSRE